MKLLVEPSIKNYIDKKSIDGIIVSLKDLSVGSEIYYTKEEIKKISEEYPDLEIFVNINKNFFNEDLNLLEENLLYLEKINIKGILFYDLAVLQLKRKLNLTNDLVWSQTHMVNNYKTCNYYHKKGVKYAYLSKEITLDETLEIITKANTISMVEVVGMPSVAFSERKLITNYYKDLNKSPKKKLTVTEKITNQEYELTEDNNGTNFILKKITNATSIIKDLYNVNTGYIVVKQYGLEEFNINELLKDIKTYINNKCLDEAFIEKYKVLGDNTNFFFKKTIYQVKKEK